MRLKESNVIQNWHFLTPSETASELKTDPENRLASAEAQARLAQSGANQPPQAPAPPGASSSISSKA